MTDRSVGHDHVVAEDPLERGADPGQRVSRLLVPGVRLEFHPIGAERLERVGQLQQLRLAVRAGPLVGGADPRPADLEPAVLGDDRQEPAAADRPPAGAVDGGEGRSVPASWLGERGLGPAPEAGLVLAGP